MSQGLKPVNCSRDSSGGRPLHSNYQHNRRCWRYFTTSTSLATGCTQCWWLQWRTV